MQVYRGMDIGTAKPGLELLKRLPHHLIDIRNPDEQFNVGDFVRLADEAVATISARGALPVIAGGTAFYLYNFVTGLPEAPPSDQGLREELREELTLKGAAALMAELAEKDPISAARIHINDEYRLLRALEVCRLTGRPLSDFSRPEEDNSRPEYRFILMTLERPRAELYRRIDLRCKEMFETGLAEELQGLYDAGYRPDDPGMKAIGYKEFFVSGDGWVLSKDLAGVETLVARNSRRYAKRQITWLNAWAQKADFIRINAGEGAADPVQAIRQAVKAIRPV
jgi:tRNA dimethylallyltransferase